MDELRASGMGGNPDADENQCFSKTVLSKTGAFGDRDQGDGFWFRAGGSVDGSREKADEGR